MSEEEVCNINKKVQPPNVLSFIYQSSCYEDQFGEDWNGKQSSFWERRNIFFLCQFNDTTLDRKGRLCFSTHLCLGYDSTASSFIRPRSLHSVLLTGERHAADQNTRLGWIEPAKLKLMGFDLSDFRIYFNLINLNWVHFSEKFLRAQLISSGSNLSAGSNLMRDFFWVLNCYICLFKITNSKSKEKPLANCINALQRKHILSRSITGTVCNILKKKWN